MRRAFFDLFRKQLIYRGKRLVNWDTFLQTAVSDDELFHEAVQGHFWHFRYPVIDPRPGEPTHVTVATTRPETMLGDTAVAVHPDPAGALDRAEEELRIKLAGRLNGIGRKSGRRSTKSGSGGGSVLAQLRELRDMARQGRLVQLPLMDRPMPLIADAWAKPELGSGCVKITPAHDANDYEVGLRHRLPMINILNPDGTLNANAGRYSGLTVEQARDGWWTTWTSWVCSSRSRTARLTWPIRIAARRPSSRTWPINGSCTWSNWPRRRWTRCETAGSRSSRPVSKRVTWIGWPRSETGPSAANCGGDTRFPSGPGCAPVRRTRIGPRHNWTATQPWRTLAWPTASRRTEDREAATDQSPDGRPWGTIHVCIQDQDTEREKHYEQLGYVRDGDVLDTWFSSALWPHSTLGWPEKTPELAYYYPTSTLITNRDIITLWVARMVLAGLNNMGEVPFREVFIHPKILDGYGEGMSKSKGNGVDPLDVIDKFGADALRFGLAYLTTQTQDIRMPVQFECPHCHSLIEQTRENRELPRVQCPKCHAPFATQWARTEQDRALPRGAVVNERFELARNFCNKLWNASRFALLNLEDFVPAPVSAQDLTLEDRWILSRLATVTQQVTEALESYRYAEAARTLYDFAWDEFCSFYVEMLKQRLGDPATRAVAQRLLAHTLDSLLRLLHPMVPFITEEVWQLLAKAAPQRGLTAPAPVAESVMVAPWPQPETSRQDAMTEQRFACFQAALGALREIRSRQNIAPRQEIAFCVQCDVQTANLLAPIQSYFSSMAKAHSTGWGPSVEAPPNSTKVQLPDMAIFVDLMGLIDVPAEIARNQKQQVKLQGMIQGKEAKLANAGFVDRARPTSCSANATAWPSSREQLKSVQAALTSLQQGAS